MARKIYKDKNIIITIIYPDRQPDFWYVDILKDKYENKDISDRKTTRISKHQESVVPPNDIEVNFENAKKYAIDEGVSFCKECGAKVPVGKLKRDNGYVANVCGQCKGKCTECGGSNWKSLGRKNPHSTTSPPRWECKSCGNIKKGITTG